MTLPRALESHPERVPRRDVVPEPGMTFARRVNDCTAQWSHRASTCAPRWCEHRLRLVAADGAGRSCGGASSRRVFGYASRGRPVRHGGAAVLRVAVRVFPEPGETSAQVSGRQGVASEPHDAHGREALAVEPHDAAPHPSLMHDANTIDLRAAELVSLCDACGTPITPERARFFALFGRSDESVLASAAERQEHAPAALSMLRNGRTAEPSAEDIEEGAAAIMEAAGVDYATALEMLGDGDEDVEGDSAEGDELLELLEGDDGAAD